MGNNERAVMNVAYEADNLGYTPVVLGYIIEGEASDVAGVYTSLAEQYQTSGSAGRFVRGILSWKDTGRGNWRRRDDGNS